MAPLVLMFVGSVLLANGLVLLGKMSPVAASPINYFLGFSLIGVVLFLTLPYLNDPDNLTSAALGSAGYLLFAFTYLYVAIGNAKNLDSRGLGWYCGWAVLVSIFLSYVNFSIFDDPRFGVVWIAWAVLFWSFFIALALRWNNVDRAVGVLTALQAFTTAAIPGALILTDNWDSTPLVAIIIVEVVPVAIFLAMLATRQRSNPQSDNKTAPNGAIAAAG